MPSADEPQEDFGWNYKLNTGFLSLSEPAHRELPQARVHGAEACVVWCGLRDLSLLQHEEWKRHHPVWQRRTDLYAAHAGPDARPHPAPLTQTDQRGAHTHLTHLTLSFSHEITEMCLTLINPFTQIDILTALSPVHNSPNVPVFLFISKQRRKILYKSNPDLGGGFEQFHAARLIVFTFHLEAGLSKITAVDQQGQTNSIRENIRNEWKCVWTL